MTWTVVVMALGLVAVFEGLVLALAPNRMEELLAFISSLSLESRRNLGLGIIALGVGVIWLATRLAG
ncbi:MAG: DUF2065 domain-containing protein [Albidovulum sp.]|jgi:uncharacterized protein YjeT (DUF2065 family)